MTTRRSTVLATILAAAAALACDVRVNDKGVSLDVSDGGRAEDEWKRTYPLARGGQFELNVFAGDINISQASGGAVEVLARREAHAKTDEEARAFLGTSLISEEVSADRVSIDGTQLKGKQDFRRRIRIDYRIGIPPGLNVSIRNEFGRVALENVTGRFAINSTNSRIEAEGVSGGFEIETVNGGVQMEIAAITSDIRMRTVNGGIVLHLPTNTNATLEATTINGGVSVDASLKLTPTTKEPQRLSGRLGTGTGPRIELSTTNGGVQLDGYVPR
jgi:hypothetical protein